MSRVLKTLAGAYAVFCGPALCVIPAGANGWFGFVPDSLSAVPAVLLALPWSLGFGLLEEVGALSGAVALVVAIVVNAGMLYGVSRLVKKER